jgi:hypothetical protein
MYQSHFRHTVSGIIILLAIIACALPGQTIQPTPGIDPNAMETAIARTLEASAKQTEQASLIPSVVPTETLTPVPKISSSGTSLVSLADGSTQFIDYVAGMQIDIPPGWLVVRVGESEYYAAWENEVIKYPIFVDIFASMQNLDPKAFRMSAFDIRPDRISSNDVPEIGVVFGDEDTRTLNEIQADQKQNPPPLTGYKLLSSKFSETSQGIQTLNEEIQWNYTNAAGQPTTGYRKRVFLAAPAGIVAIDLLIIFDKKDLMMPEFDQILNSITLFTP